MRAGTRQAWHSAAWGNSSQLFWNSANGLWQLLRTGNANEQGGFHTLWPVTSKRNRGNTGTRWEEVHMTGGLQGMNGRSRSEKRLEDQQTNTKMNYYGGTKAVVLNLFFHRAALWSKYKSHGPHACHLHITSSIQTNQIYNIIVSKLLHLLK